MVTQTNWYILTGGPCSGKSKVLEYLKSKGHNISKEAARNIIDKGIAKGKTVEEIKKDEIKFQNDILNLKIKIENKLDPKQIIFFDRGIPDSIVYFKEAGLDADIAIKESGKIKYKKVFFLKQPHIKNDYARTEDVKTSKRISKLLFEAYTKLGYNLITVPVTKIIEEKAEIILNNL